MTFPFMFPTHPLELSKGLLTALGTRLFLYHENRRSLDGPVLVVSNHRSFMDAPLLMAATDRPIRFACHHYMSQVPLMRDLVTQLGCFPLEAAGQGQQSFFQKATHLLKTQQTVGIFPEGTQPMVHSSAPDALGEFHRGFAHLALRVPVDSLAVLPVAIVPQKESINTTVPLRFLRFFDPSEPLFDQDGWHPLVTYHRVHVAIGRPYWITPDHRSHYRGKNARTIVSEVTDYCQGEISDLIQKGFYTL
ncbi:MAG: lysophospholipid acyltransferase family protein [Leptolyngbyaceae cyanobacterium bins.59]|nr:lysophospholipid acyltransferase family protein [Leptolyngbyaceae cyanobacterium bins.59]